MVNSVQFPFVLFSRSA